MSAPAIQATLLASDSTRREVDKNAGKTRDSAVFSGSDPGRVRCRGGASNRTAAWLRAQGDDSNQRPVAGGRRQRAAVSARQQPLRLHQPRQGLLTISGGESGA